MSKQISEDEIFQVIKQMYTETSQESKTDISSKESDNSSFKSWVKVENNKIIFAADEGSEVAFIKAEDPVQIRINGKLMTSRVMLMPGDKIEWDTVIKPMYKIEVSKDKMFVYFQVITLTRYNWNLINKEASQDLIVEAEEDKSMVIQTIDFSEILAVLAKMSIVKNLKPTVIYQELLNPSFTPVVIAQGLEPTPSQDARLEVLFNEQIEHNNFEDVGGTIDFRNHLRIPSAKVGDAIARKIPVVEGAFGYDVFGSIVKPSIPRDKIVIAKENVLLNEAGEFIAQREGRPRVTGQQINYLDINPSYIVSGDVDLKTGNIVFSGDVIVYGNVLDGMIIESMGNVYVTGSVYKATITATGSIVVIGNIVGSFLYSGYFGVIFNRLYISTKKLNDILLGLMDALKVLISILEAKGKEPSFGQLLMILIESKFKELPQTVANIMTSISNMQNIKADEMSEIKDKLMTLSNPLTIMKINSINYIMSLQNVIHELALSIERTQEGKVLIDIHQCHLSDLKSNGDVLIRREGVLQSNVYAKGNIIFYEMDSVCRGSQLDAEGSISAMQVGGETGGECTLKAGKKIMFNRMSIGKVCIGKCCRVVERPLESTTIYLKNSELIFEKVI